jgi:hypothetical protein
VTEPINSCVIVPVDNASTERPGTDKDARWSKSLRLLRQTLMNVLADHGKEQHPYPDGPVVRAVELETVRQEFYRSCLVEADTEAKKQAARRQAIPPGNQGSPSGQPHRSPSRGRHRARVAHQARAPDWTAWA